MRIIQIIAVCLLGSCFLTLPSAYSQSSSNDNNKEIINSLLKNLEQTIEDADKRMVAHPSFLNELRELVREYKGKLRKVFFFDNFSDGDYIKNPTWKIRQGQFSITSDEKLKSIVKLEPPPASTSSSDKESNLEALFDSLFGGDDDEEEVKSNDQQPKKKDKALIESLAQIGPAFEVDFSFITETTDGVMEVTLLGGKKNKPRYRLIYRFSLEKAFPIRIIRAGKAEKRRVIKTEALPSITEKNQLHILQWILNEKGNMEVLFDGKQILSTKEHFYKGGFTGIRLVNRGGTFKWGPIQILEPPI